MCYNIVNIVSYYWLPPRMLGADPVEPFDLQKSAHLLTDLSGHIPNYQSFKGIP